MLARKLAANILAVAVFLRAVGGIPAGAAGYAVRKEVGMVIGAAVVVGCLRRSGG